MQFHIYTVSNDMSDYMSDISADVYDNMSDDILTF